MATHAGIDRSLTIDRCGGETVATLTLPGSITHGIIRHDVAKKLKPGDRDISEWTGDELSYFAHNCFETSDVMFVH
jgi:hypothetical protein